MGAASTSMLARPPRGMLPICIRTADAIWGTSRTHTHIHPHPHPHTYTYPTWEGGGGVFLEASVYQNAVAGRLRDCDTWFPLVRFTDLDMSRILNPVTGALACTVRSYPIRVILFLLSPHQVYQLPKGSSRRQPTSECSLWSCRGQ